MAFAFSSGRNINIYHVQKRTRNLPKNKMRREHTYGKETGMFLFGGLKKTRGKNAKRFAANVVPGAL